MFKLAKLSSPPLFCAIATLAIAPAAAMAQHKTGLDLEFKLVHTSEQEDALVEGDRNTLEFSQAKARWFLSGKTDYLGYKMEYDFGDGEVDLRQVKFDLFLSPATTLSMGKGFKPIPISGPLKYNKGDVGIQLLTNFDSGASLKLGLANLKPTYWANGIDTYTTLPAWGYGAELKGKFKPLETYVRVAARRIPREKVIATGFEYKGRDEVDVTVGGIYKAGGTKLQLDVSQTTKSQVKESQNGGPDTVIAAKHEERGAKVTWTQGFTSQWSGKFAVKQVEERDDGKKSLDATEIDAEAIYKPYKNEPVTVYLKFEHDTDKAPGEKKVVTKKVSLGAKAKPSYVIAKK